MFCSMTPCHTIVLSCIQSICTKNMLFKIATLRELRPRVGIFACMATGGGFTLYALYLKCHITNEIYS